MGGDVEPQDPMVKLLGLWDIANLQMDVPHARPGREHVPGRVSPFVHQAPQVDRIERHRHRPTGPRPLVAWPVAVDLDAVAVGVRDIQGLADQVVRLPDLQTRLRHAQQGPPEVRPARQQHGKMVQPRGPPRLWRRARHLPKL